ncbi:MAG TPA: hypothetical protein VK806_12355 [Bacteroidia bacterium]|nr:hypothetical protein [Bacteroidia bacterium]
MYTKVKILLICGMVLFFSCKKDQTSSPVSTTPTATMSANVGGNTENFSPSIIFNSVGMTLIGTYSVGALQYQIQIFAIRPTSNYIGTYSLYRWTGGDYSANAGTGFSEQFNYNTDTNHSGIFNITNYNTQLNTISGTFSFLGNQTYPQIDSGKYTINVTNGVFANVKL